MTTAIASPQTITEQIAKRQRENAEALAADYWALVRDLNSGKVKNWELACDLAEAMGKDQAAIEADCQLLKQCTTDATLHGQLPSLKADMAIALHELEGRSAKLNLHITAENKVINELRDGATSLARRISGCENASATLQHMRRSAAFEA